MPGTIVSALLAAFLGACTGWSIPLATPAASLTPGPDPSRLSPSPAATPNPTEVAASGGTASTPPSTSLHASPPSTSLHASPTPGPTAKSRRTPDPATVPLPMCRFGDEPVAGDPATDWKTLLLDTTFRLPADFAPERLVSTRTAGLQRGYEVIPAVVDDLRAMHEASIAAGEEIAVRWAYRSYGEQAGAFAYWVRQSGRERALEISARPGHSEHQLGTAIDFRSADSLKAPWDYEDWGATGPGTWIAEHAWEFGFVLSYPKGMEDETCYGYEPWHYRYVGRKVAAAVHDRGVTLRRYLWKLGGSE